MNQKKEEVWDIYDDPTMLDVAASIINDMLVTAIKEKNRKMKYRCTIGRKGHYGPATSH